MLTENHAFLLPNVTRKKGRENNKNKRHTDIMIDRQIKKETKTKKERRRKEFQKEKKKKERKNFKVLIF